MCVIRWVYYSFSCLEGCSWLEEWRRDKKKTEKERKITTIERDGELIQTHIIFFFGPKTSWCQASATGWYSRFPSFYLFIFILPIAIFIDAHSRRLVHFILWRRKTRGLFVSHVYIAVQNTVNWAFLFFLRRGRRVMRQNSFPFCLWKFKIKTSFIVCSTLVVSMPYNSHEFVVVVAASVVWRGEI
jgi:hypothetical protein